MKIGRVCIKITGRDARKKCVIIDIEENRVLIDGETRRRKVNPAHLEPLNEKIKIEKGADHATVMKALGLEVKEKKVKESKEKPKKQRKADSKKQS